MSKFCIQRTCICIFLISIWSVRVIIIIDIMYIFIPIRNICICCQHFYSAKRINIYIVFGNLITPPFAASNPIGQPCSNHIGCRTAKTVSCDQYFQIFLCLNGWILVNVIVYSLPY